MGNAAPITRATAGLPPPCVDCVFWQHPHAISGARRKERWSRTMGEQSWGRVLHDEGRFRGMLQYGPSRVFARSHRLPAGPPDRDAALITCSYLAPTDAAEACERLVLQALADLKTRRFAAVEAFALRYPDEVATAERFTGHHTLFDRDFLEALGFGAVRSQGQVALMRLELGGLEPAPSLMARLGERLRYVAQEPRPTPA